MDKKKKKIKKTLRKSKHVSKSTASSPKKREMKQEEPANLKISPKEESPALPSRPSQPRREAVLEDGGKEEIAGRDGDGEVTLDKTAMRIYLQQIEMIPLLTPEEEIDLSQKVQSGTRGAKEARHKMIRSNLRLVISLAKRYANIGLPFSDLVEEGNIGLMRAVDKFNPERGYRFSTYASWWIKQAIMRALSNQGKTIRVPVYMFDTLSKFRKIRDGLVQQLSRIPTDKEIAGAMSIPIEKVKELERITSQPGSLHAPVSLDGSAEMMDLIQDEKANSPIENVEGFFEGERIDQILNYVDERERQILILLFGLKGGEPHTLEDTAKQFSVTRERIRQIELAAIKKIRYMLKLKEEKLEDYVG